MHDSTGDVSARRALTASSPATGVCRVIVAGGRQLLRDGIRALLTSFADIEVVGAAADGLAAGAAVASGGADVVVTHAFLADRGGGAALAIELRERAPGVGVVLLLGDGDAGEVRNVLDQGTQGRAVLLMDHPRCAEELHRAVHEVAAGGSVVHAGVVDVILRAGTTMPDALAHLTPRERQVLAGIATGATNRGIASHLGMSERAVEKHINQLYAKLDLGPEADVHRRVTAAIHYLGATPG